VTRQRVLAQQGHGDHRRVPGQDARVVGHQQRAPVSRDARHPFGLHSPPAVIEKAEYRLDQLGEVLVEAPLVLRVFTLQSSQHPGHGLPAVAGKDPGRAGQGVGQLEAGVQTVAHPAQERDRGGVDHAAAADRLGRRTQSSTAAAVE
jgi:hypothetical protein